MKSHVKIYAEQLAALKKLSLTLEMKTKVKEYLATEGCLECSEINADKIYPRRDSNVIDEFIQNCSQKDNMLSLPENLTAETPVELLVILQRYSSKELSLLLAAKIFRNILIHRPERSSKNSWRIFLCDLSERLKIAEPMFGDETYTLLGYKKDDIALLEDFFEEKQFSGTLALRVQKTLKRIWLETPIADSVFTQELFFEINKLFEEINKKNKKGISFEDIPPVSGEITEEKLINDWLTRWERYAQALNIDLAADIDNVDIVKIGSMYARYQNYGKRFPVENSEYEIFEFLNFWMPYLLFFPDTEVDKARYASDLLLFNKSARNIRSKWFKPYKDYFEDLHFSKKSDLEFDFKKSKSEFLETLKNIFTQLNSIDFGQNQSGYSIWQKWQESKTKICELLKKYFAMCHSANMVVELNQCEVIDLISQLTEPCEVAYDAFGDRLALPILPRFVDPLYEFVANNDSHKAQVIFYSCRDKLYIPYDWVSFFTEEQIIASIDIKLMFKEYDDAFAVLSNVPHALDINQLWEFYNENYDTLRNPEERLFCKWEEKVLSLFQGGAEQIEHAIKDEFDRALKSPCLLHNKLTILKFIKVRFSIADHYMDGYMDDRIKELEAQNPQRPTVQKFSSFANQLQTYYDIDKFERGQEELKRGLEAEKTKSETQKRLFSQLNHSIKNLVSSVSKTLSWTKSEYDLSTPVRRLINRASQGASLLSAIANAISLSYREDGDYWQKDLNAENDTESMSKIIQTALFQAVPNILSGDNITQYRHEYELYFPTEEEQKTAETLWYQASSAELKLKWINENLFSLNFNIDEMVKDLQIGDEYATLTHFFIFFSEIFLNTTKAVAYVDKQFRKCDVDITISNGFLTFDLKNSSCSDRTQKKDGFGHIIIENYCKKFDIKDFIETYDMKEKMYKLYFKLPIVSREGEK